ncbi:hypothetical protein HYC85_012975 [Camellia sinensis]|uniref:Serpin domain-containing protein n=1 Tax=Camellia sinensis TaxID=4442 RepID=A0A7J7HDI7_CAMSI|nr:hypothetical protein HYC85_012975 [Camellia sinensis]
MVSSKRRVKPNGSNSMKVVPDGVDLVSLSLLVSGPVKQCDWITPNSGNLNGSIPIEVVGLKRLLADQVIDEVNSCVKNETKGLIKNFLPPGCLYGDTALLFANALYCKGQWDQKFDKTRTRNMNFHLLDGEIF